MVVANYRLSPDVAHPAHVKDAARVFAWTKQHIAEYGGDPAKVYVVGYSAGAYLAALLATDARYLAEVGFTPGDIRWGRRGRRVLLGGRDRARSRQVRVGRGPARVARHITGASRRAGDSRPR